MTCLLCHGPISQQKRLSEILFWRKIEEEVCCHTCLSYFLPINHSSQKRCGDCLKILDKVPCPDCRYWRERYPNIQLSHHALFEYNQWMADYFSKFKFQGDIRLGKIFRQDIRSIMLNYPDAIIVPIPTTFTREEERGFNQVEVLLKEAGVSFNPLLFKAHDNGKQSDKNRVERLTTNHSFQIHTKYHELIRNKTIVLVDDVYTSGCTMIQAYACFQEYSPKKLLSFSLAR